MAAALRRRSENHRPQIEHQSRGSHSHRGNACRIQVAHQERLSHRQDSRDVVAMGDHQRNAHAARPVHDRGCADQTRRDLRAGEGGNERYRRPARGTVQRLQCELGRECCSAADAIHRRASSGAAGAVRRGWIRAVDCLRERSEPAAGARRSTAERDGRARRDRRGALAHRASVVD